MRHFRASESCNVGAESQPRRTAAPLRLLTMLALDVSSNTTCPQTTFNAFAMTAYESPNAEIALDSMRKRVQSFPTEPLHSAAYLNDIVRYLSNEPPGSARHRAPSPAPKECNSVYAYEISGSHAPHTVSYSQASSLLIENANRAHLELLCFTGSPSPEWMEALVDRVDVDVRFLHSHLDFIPNAQRDWYTGSNLPSRNRQDFRLLNPSIVFLGMEGKILSVNQLHAARKSCASQPEKQA
jgi:hypothetical protein